MGHIREENLLKKGAYLRPIENIFCCCLVSGFKCHFQTCCVFRNTALAFFKNYPLRGPRRDRRAPFCNKPEDVSFSWGIAGTYGRGSKI